MDGAPTPAADAALSALLEALAARGYAFTTPTPSTSRRVAERRDEAGEEDALRDVFGWSRPFAPERLDGEVLDLLRASGAVERDGGRLRATVRVSTLDGRAYVHSAPGRAQDAVFLGPDSYRYARWLRQALAGVRFAAAVDLGVGAGVGAMTLQALAPGAHVAGTDVNPLALRYARLNAAHARLPLELVLADGLPPGDGRFDVVAANPPYIAEDDGPTYRAGGGDLGADIGLKWAREGLARLNPGGRLLLYTGSAIVRGRDHVRSVLQDLAAATGATLGYEEIDPDVFGETLRRPAYREVERIAAVGAVLTAP